MIEVRKVLLEGVGVAVIGTAVALAANAISPRGLLLTRDYFPGAARTPPPAARASDLTRGIGGITSGANTLAESVAARLQAKGLQLAAHHQVVQLFRDPRYAQGLVVFVDARDDQRYQEGHIPGAFQFDHYHAERYLAGVLPICQTAEQVVVYCTGADCEDSEFAATTLSDAGIPKAKLLVYGGGLTEWTANRLPLETGQH